MTLGTSRIMLQGETPHAHERDAIAFAIEALPNVDPYHVWGLVELLEPSSGRLYEIDLIVLGYSALYVIEVKSGPGRYEGDSLDWRRKAPEDPSARYMENPYRLTNTKAKVLAARLRARLKDPRHMPWIEPLVFLSAHDVELKFRNFGDLGVVTRANLKQAVAFHDFPGVDRSKQRSPITAPAMRDIAQALKELGLRPRRDRLTVGAYELGDLLLDGPGFQDRLAIHRDQKSIQRRARTYAVPQQTSVERRQQLRRAADREVQLLWDVREHEHVLRFAEYVSDAELGPTVFFDAFDGISLDAFLRNEPHLSFYDRLELVTQVARALSHCHKKGVVHGALSPEAVLVRRSGNTLTTRLFNFQLGAQLGPAAGGSTEVEATSHWSALASDPWAIYQAPELRENPTQRSPTSDMWSLGALASFIFTNKPPAASAVDVDQLLVRQRCLDVRAIDDTIPEKIAALIADATQVSPVLRSDDAETWIELMLEEMTRPAAAPAAAAVDPLAAKPGDVLDGLSVVKTPDGRPILGQGATSRVLLVQRDDGRSYALKVPLGPEHDARLAEEANVLDQMRHARIVQLIDRPVLATRPCLLLSLAGTDTLHRYLQREGTVSLERAIRYGEDLLSALEHLEEHGILHRDIKPANLGVGSVGKKADHLVLFDFSLTTAPKTDLHVGTAAYRDPFLRLRGTWDAAAERWSAAVTLHEMLTGARPNFGDLAIGATALDVDAHIVVATERFDASVRDNLAAFFERALARDVEHRFASTDEMRRAWLAAFDVERVAKARPRKRDDVVDTLAAPDGPAAEPSDNAEERVAFDVAAVLANLGKDAPIEALPLSARAKNALDRAGLLSARDVLALADNRLSAIRGIGRVVAEEILGLRDVWRQTQADSVVEFAAFFPNYRGDDVALDGTTLGARVVFALESAGLTTTSTLAAAPAEQVQALARKNAFDVRALVAMLDGHNAAKNERLRPSTIEGYVEALLPKKKKSLKLVRELYGLEGPCAGQLDVAPRVLADAVGVSRAAVYLALSRLREEVGDAPAYQELKSQVRGVVEQAGGAVSAAAAARTLLGQIPHDRNADKEAVLVLATALVRLVVEIDSHADSDGGLQTFRDVADRLWVCVSDAHARGTRALGAVADELAKRTAVPGPGEVARALAEAVVNSPLAALSSDRLADLATSASAGAAKSARLEIYPRNMAPERALSLSASHLKGGMSAADIVMRVRARYPDAQPLPERPALDELLQPYGLRFTGKVFEREGEAEHTMMATRVSSVQRAPTALPTQALSMEPDALLARQFDEQLRNAIERRAFRVLGVRADHAREAALRLGDRLGVAPTAIDKLLVGQIRAQMKKLPREDIVHDADRAGRAGAAWPKLQTLVKAAATDVERSLFHGPRTAPLLLVQPGLLSRYRLEGFVQALVEFATAKDTQAPVFLLVPGPDTGGIPRINGELPLPGVIPGQVLWVSLDWLKNRHNAPQGVLVDAAS